MVTRIKAIALFGIIGFAIALTLACTPTPKATPAPQPEATEGEPKYGGTFISVPTRYGGGYEEMSFWDPYPNTHTGSISFASMVYSKPMQYSQDPRYEFQQFVPEGDLVESWEQTSDTAYSFRLRNGVKFQDKPPVNGQELTTADVN